MTYRAISLDVGYTLLAPVHEANHVVRQLLDTLGVHPTDAALTAAYEHAEVLFHHRYNQPLNDTWGSDAGISGFFEEYYALLLGHLGIGDDDHRHARAIIGHYLEPSNWQLYPGVRATLEALRARGLRVGIASDWGTDLRAILRAHGLVPLLDWAVISGGIGSAKPAPAFYRQVVARAEVPAATILHIGDNYRADVLGARTVGMAGALIDWTGKPHPPLDVPVLHSLPELLALLDATAA